ncbi:MAG TPA: hypothetical protein P5068_12855 [Sedimentisphaerales bacterium]|nr:hypothetical protein [Sedimentisphaerales bacterium]HRV48649.1 hypothetical protein [Sedimentisphaerales bacterium]
MLAPVEHSFSMVRSLLLGTILACVASAPAQRRGGQADTVAEIHFGFVEPPVVAQRDITVEAPVSAQAREVKALECSGMAWADGRLILASDRHGLVLFTCPIDLQQLTIGTPSPRVVIGNEQELLDDAECLVVQPDSRREQVVYVMCSLSNDPDELPLPKRRHMLRVALRDLDPARVARPVVLSAGRLRDLINDRFEAVGIEPYRTFHPDFSGSDKNTYRWGNIEGMCFTPDGKRLLLGMRNPLLGSHALMAVVVGIEEAFDTRDANKLDLVDLFAIDLGDRGVSDLCWDPLTRGYLITAARSNGPKLSKDQPFPPNTLDSALFWWSGHKQDRPILFARFPDMKVEAVCRLGNTPFIAVASDEGDVSEGRPQQQQSVVTVMYFTGIAIGSQDGTDVSQR